MFITIHKKFQRLISTSLPGTLFLFAIIVRLFAPFGVQAETSSPSSVAPLATTLSATTEEHLFSPNVVTPDKKVKTVLTAYSSTPDQTDGDPFTAANGKHVYDGMIAANWLPFGTQVKIPELFGNKIFTVGDRMNARYGYGRIDIWMDAPRAQVNAFGVKRATIEVYYGGATATAQNTKKTASFLARK
jgi:hypothetical protein